MSDVLQRRGSISDTTNFTASHDRAMHHICLPRLHGESEDDEDSGLEDESRRRHQGTSWRSGVCPITGHRRWALRNFHINFWIWKWHVSPWRNSFPPSNKNHGQGKYVGTLLRKNKVRPEATGKVKGTTGRQTLLRLYGVGESEGNNQGFLVEVYDA